MSDQLRSTLYRIGIPASLRRSSIASLPALLAFARGSIRMRTLTPRLCAAWSAERYQSSVMNQKATSIPPPAGSLLINASKGARQSSDRVSHSRSSAVARSATHRDKKVKTSRAAERLMCLSIPLLTRAFVQTGPQDHTAEVLECSSANDVPSKRMRQWFRSTSTDVVHVALQGWIAPRSDENLIVSATVWGSKRRAGVRVRVVQQHKRRHRRWQ